MVSSSPPFRLPPLLAIAFLAGCATMNPFHRRPATESAATVVEVRNDRWEDLTVYLQREGSLLRLGVVQGKGSAKLTVPEDYVRLNCTLRLLARTIGRDVRGASPEFGMGPGSRITWHIPLTGGVSPVAVMSPEGWNQPE